MRNRSDKSEDSNHHLVTLEFSHMRALFIFNKILAVSAGVPTEKQTKHAQAHARVFKCIKVSNTIS